MSERLGVQPGEWIDRNAPIEFRFEGETIRGYRGDVIASALWAAGVRMMGRSFKYHRPRGPYSFAGHDVNALFTDGARTNIRGDRTQAASGADYRAVNTFGSLKRDRLSMTEKFDRMMPVGFYYKAFHRPAWLFPFHERQMRKVAGLGAINRDLPPESTPKRYAFCDALVVGGGISGMAAAIAAAESGAKVTLVDENPSLGGCLAYQHGGSVQLLEALGELRETVTGHPHINVMVNTLAAGQYGDRWVALVDRERLTKMRARAVIAATGVMGQPAVFQNNDLPGVVLAEGVQRLMRLYAVKPFARAVVLTANANGYRAALDLKEAGTDVASVIDLRTEPVSSELRDAVVAAGIAVANGTTIYEAVPTNNRACVDGVVICPLDSKNTPVLDGRDTIVCDGVVVSVGYMPAGGLVSQGGGRFGYNESLHQFVPTTTPVGQFVCGSIRGVRAWEARRRDGARAGLAAAQHLGYAVANVPEAVPPADRAESHPYPVYSHPGKKNFVDFDEDLHLKDFINAHQEGYVSIELQKRYTTVGMGPSQGKLANMNSVRILAKLNGSTINETGTTTSRPFIQPVPIKMLAGRRFHPMRRTPMHGWHNDAGAAMVHAGAWYRPEYYARSAASRDECIVAEATQVRQGVGMIDVSTLGKLLVNGPDAARFLERIYTGVFGSLKPGRYRYAVALDEAAFVIEDGVVARLAEDRFYVTATSSGVAAFYREMQRWALMWGMDVTLSNVTAHLGAMNVAGPTSRQVLAPLTDVDLSAEAFEYLGVREGRVAGCSAKLMRVGFVGELGYEIHTPAEHAEKVWRAVMEAGGSEGIRPFGVEAQRLLRLEKGHLIIGHDTDALTHPDEAGLGWTIGRDKPFFVGQRSIEIIRKRRVPRRLVGIRFEADSDQRLPEECHLVINEGRIAGRVTSIAHSTTLGYPVGMAFVEPDLSNPGTRVTIRVGGGSMVTAEVTKLPFYDPDNNRQRS